MAFPVSHVIYAKRYLDLHPAMDADQFLLGTLFPDIRRITDEVSRSETHHYFKKLDLDFGQLTPFDAGWKYHLWCDMRREEILGKYKFYNLPHTADDDAPTKLLEDELLYEKYQNWEKLRLILNNPPAVELNLAVSREPRAANLEVRGETIERWYAIVAKYFEKKPDDKTMKAFLFKQRRLRARSEEIIDLVGKLRENRKAVEILSKIPEEILE